MRLSDAYTIANLVPSLELMYRAAYGVFKAADWHGQTAIVVGSGNNGGDGFALACILILFLNKTLQINTKICYTISG